MVYKAKLIKIPALKIDTAKMSQQELMSYETKINAFIEELPSTINLLKQSMSNKDSGTLSDCLYDILELLKGIKADDLEKNCMKIIGEALVSIDAVESELTIFISTLTALSIDMQMAFHEGEVPQIMSSGSESGEKLILAVDDAPFLLQTLKMHLQDSPYKLVCVTSGAEALRFIKRKTPDLYILDIEMPEMDGYDLALEIAATGKTAPIIFLTGNSDKDSVIRALTLGAADFIIKPVGKEQVLSRISKHI
jgi:CheY-like chemotaxis protein